MKLLSLTSYNLKSIRKRGRGESGPTPLLGTLGAYAGNCCQGAKPYQKYGSLCFNLFRAHWQETYEYCVVLSTLANQVLLWLQWRDASDLHTPATSTGFSPMSKGSTPTVRAISTNCTGLRAARNPESGLCLRNNHK